MRLWRTSQQGLFTAHLVCVRGLNTIAQFQVIDETLSPTWDELLVFEEVLVYGRREDIKANPPIVIIEIYDQDKVGTASSLLHCTNNNPSPSFLWFL